MESTLLDKDMLFVQILIIIFVPIAVVKQGLDYFVQINPIELPAGCQPAIARSRMWATL